eukprot:m.4893 g.4893  ORF g.4893 m.4893 type:complete len:175 (-) comp4050_c0_seq1:120-644(-)
MSGKTVGEEEMEVNSTIKEIYQLYTNLLTAIKPQNAQVNRLHEDLSSEMESFSTEVTVSRLIHNIEKLLTLCNNLEDILLTQDVETVNKLRMRQRAELEKSIQTLSSRLEGRNATLDASIDAFISDSFGDPFAEASTPQSTVTQHNSNNTSTTTNSQIKGHINQPTTTTTATIQ